MSLRNVYILVTLILLWSQKEIFMFSYVHSYNIYLESFQFNSYGSSLHFNSIWCEDVSCSVMETSSEMLCGSIPGLWSVQPLIQVCSWTPACFIRVTLTVSLNTFCTTFINPDSLWHLQLVTGHPPITTFIQNLSNRDQDSSLVHQSPAEVKTLMCHGL